MKEASPPGESIMVNRVKALMIHCDRYSGRGGERLASDARVHRSNICRLLHGHQNPSYRFVCRVVGALEQQLGCRIDPREIVVEGGKFRTASVCELAGCPGCLPEEVFTPDGDLKHEHRGLQPGRWSHDAPGELTPIPDLDQLQQIEELG